MRGGTGFLEPREKKNSMGSLRVEADVETAVATAPRGLAEVPLHPRAARGPRVVYEHSSVPLLADVAVPVPLAHAFTYSVPAELAVRAVPGAR